MMLVRNAAAVLLALAAATAEGRPQDAMPNAPAALSPQARLEIAASVLRVGAADLLRRGDPAASASPALAGAEGERLSALWAHSVQHAHFRGNVALVGWWHPFANGWTLSRWRQGADGWRMEALGFALGEALDPATADWTGAARALAAALRLRGERAARAFDAAAASGRLEPYLEPERARAERDAMLARSDSSRRDPLVSGESDEGRFYRAWLGRTLVTGAAAMPADARLRAALARLPSELRLTLQPAAVFRRPDGLSFALQSPLEASIVIFVHFLDRPAGAPRPARVELVRLHV